MKKIMENYLGVIIFYSVLIVGALLLCTRMERVNALENNEHVIYQNNMIANK